MPTIAFTRHALQRVRDRKLTWFALWLAIREPHRVCLTNGANTTRRLHYRNGLCVVLAPPRYGDVDAVVVTVYAVTS